MGIFEPWYVAWYQHGLLKISECLCTMDIHDSWRFMIHLTPESSAVLKFYVKLMIILLRFWAHTSNEVQRHQAYSFRQSFLSYLLVTFIRGVSKSLKWNRVWLNYISFPLNPLKWRILSIEALASNELPRPLGERWKEKEENPMSFLPETGPTSLRWYALVLSFCEKLQLYLERTEKYIIRGKHHILFSLQLTQSWLLFLCLLFIIN